MKDGFEIIAAICIGLFVAAFVFGFIAEMMGV